MEEAEKLLHQLRSDPNFREFCSATFDPAEFSSHVVAAGGGKLLDPSQPTEGAEAMAGSSGSSQAEVTLQAVGTGLAKVKAALKAHVSAHRLELASGMHVGQGGGATLSQRCDQTRSGTAELRRSLQRMRTEVFEPYESVRTRVLQLQHLSQAQKILKRCLRVLFALRKLRQQVPQLGLGGSEGGSEPAPLPAADTADLRELATAAQSVYELEKLFADPMMTGIELVEGERAFVRRAGERVRRLAGERLERGLRALNQAEVAGALQVFHNLRCLPDRCRAGVSRLVDKAAELVRRGLEMESLKALVPSSVSAPGLSAREAEAMAARQLRTRRREHCDSLANELYTIAMQARQLQQVLVKKQDPTTQEYFIDVLRKDAEKYSTGKGQRRKATSEKSRTAMSPMGVFADFWKSLTAALTTICKEAQVNAQSSESEPASALADLYPFLRRSFLHLSKRLEESTQGDHKAALQLASLAESQPAPRSSVDLFDERLTGILGGADFVLNDILEMSSTEAYLAESQLPWDTPPVKPSLKTNDSKAVIRPVTNDDLCIKDFLLDSLNPLRDSFLCESLGRLTSPVNQMFPEVEGYAAAVPSKHDLAFIVRACHVELQRANPEIGGGEATLAPFLAKGVSKAIKLIAQKVEGMAFTDQSAFQMSAALLAKEPADQKLHHIHLLNLVSRLRQDVQDLPTLGQVPGTQDTIESLMAEEAASIQGEVNSIFQSALKALDNVAQEMLIEPYFLGVASHLETLLAEVHKEHFGEGSVDASSMECSLYLSTFQSALQTFLSVHAGQFPDAPFTRAGVATLCRRLTFSLVSHLALVRPLGEQGRLTLAKDLAVFEAALGTLTKVPELGEAYAELRAFRQLLFLEENPEEPFSSQLLLQEECVNNLRPSTVLHHLLSRAPDDLISPHIMHKVSSLEYVHWLIGQHQLVVSQEDDKTEQEIMVHSLDARVTFQRESEAWSFLNQSIDAYFQRLSVQQEGESSDPRLVKVILSLGPASLAAYQKRNT